MKLPALRSRRTAPDADAPRRPTPPWMRFLRVPSWSEVRGMLRRNTGMKLFAIVVATALWYSITKTERDAERVIDVPVSLRRIPDGLTVASAPTKPVSITLRGPRTLLDSVDDRNRRLQISLAGLQLGDNRIDLNGAMLSPELPRSLKAVRFEPQSLTLRADRRILRRLPVKADLAGTPALGYTVAESTVVPEVVEVTGPARIVDDLKQVTTEPIDLRAASDTVQRNVLLERVDPTITFVPDVVRITVTLEETLVSREFPKLKVAAPPEVKEVTPPAVDVTIRGPQRLLHNLKLDPDAVRVDVEGLKPGSHVVPVTITVPEGLTVVTRSPERVRVRVGGKS
jgi:YbbR domain-containing protein